MSPPRFLNILTESRLGKRRNLELAPLPNIRAYYDYWLEVMVQGIWGVLTPDYCNLNPSFTEHLSTEPLLDDHKVGVGERHQTKS